MKRAGILPYCRWIGLGLPYPDERRNLIVGKLSRHYRTALSGASAVKSIDLFRGGAQGLLFDEMIRDLREESFYDYGKPFTSRRGKVPPQVRNHSWKAREDDEALRIHVAKAIPSQILVEMQEKPLDTRKWKGHQSAS